MQADRWREPEFDPTAYRRSFHARMNWERFNRLLVGYPIPPVIAGHSLFRHAAKP